MPPDPKRPSSVTGIAVRDAAGQVHTAQGPCTHAQFRSELERKGIVLTPNPDANWDNGFMTDTGHYVSRQQAAAIAIRWEQVTDLKYPGMGLTSADLWPDVITE